jgi:hypothetical protein
VIGDSSPIEDPDKAMRAFYPILGSEAVRDLARAVAEVAGYVE